MTDTSSTDFLLRLKPGFIGAGKMGGAIIRGLLSRNPAMKIPVFEKSDAAKNTYKDNPNIVFINTIEELEKNSGVILLCVKPQDIASVLTQLSGGGSFISIAAGISISFIEKHLRKKSAVARVMPNIAAEIGQSVSGYYCEDKDLSDTVKNIFECLGSVHKVDRENQIHAVTALAGSGPAYVFSFIQALAEGGVLCGLPYDLALEMAVKTVKGSAELLEKSGRHPGALRNSVTSPGGTTIEGLAVLENGKFGGTVMKTVQAAFEKSKNLESI